MMSSALRLVMCFYMAPYVRSFAELVGFALAYDTLDYFFGRVAIVCAKSVIFVAIKIRLFSHRKDSKNSGH